MRGLNLGAAGRLLRAIGGLVQTLIGLLITALQYVVIRHRPNRSLAAENLFLRKQLALFQEREIKPRRADDATRAALVWLAQAFNWREAVVVVKPATLIRQMALENPTWGEERIAHELVLKLGLQVSARTVHKYMPEHSGGGPDRKVSDQRWTAFVRSHAEGIVACDFFTGVIATFKVVYVFIVVEHATRRILTST